MKNMIFRKRKHPQQQGSILVTALVTSAILGTTLASYLLLVRAQHLTVARSQAWNTALAIAEAGVEEALAHINPGPPKASLPNFAGNGWGMAVNGFYGPQSRTLRDGTYTVCFTDSIETPVIYSTGTVTHATLNASLSRTLRVDLTNTALFTALLASKLNIDLRGNGVYSDSFDSADPLKSDNGYYPMLYPSRTSTNGDLASLQGIVNVGTSDIKGDLLLGPSASWNIRNAGRVTGEVRHDFNADFPDAVLPQTSWVTPVAGSYNVGGVTYQYVFQTSGDFVVPTIVGNVYVGTNAHVRLRILNSSTPGVVRVAGLANQGGSLTVYMHGESFQLKSQSVVDSGNALKFLYYGLPSNTSISIQGNAMFTGVIYAPSAAFEMGGGGGNSYDFVGACVVNTIKLNGHFRLHFDENLLRQGPKRSYTVNRWQEI